MQAWPVLKRKFEEWLHGIPLARFLEGLRARGLTELVRSQYQRLQR